MMALYKEFVNYINCTAAPLIYIQGKKKRPHLIRSQNKRSGVEKGQSAGKLLAAAEEDEEEKFLCIQTANSIIVIGTRARVYICIG